MFIISLENNLINFNFIILFLAMILYWLESVSYTHLTLPTKA